MGEAKELLNKKSRQTIFTVIPTIRMLSLKEGDLWLII